MNLEDDREEEPFSLLLAQYSDTFAVDSVADTLLPSPLRQRVERALSALRRLRRSLSRLALPTLPLRKASTASVQRSASRTQRDRLIGGQIGRFRLLRMLGQGGGGIVFLAFDPQHRRKVAVKIPRLEALLIPETRRRFQREARITAALDYSNLVPVYEWGEVNGLCFLVSAYCPGGNLAEWLAQQTGPVPTGLAVRLIALLADTVQYVHTRGVFHRDIKPSNVLLDRRPTRPVSALGFTPRLIDFGLAKLQNDPSEFAGGARLGTPSYMAPEQTEGRWRDIGPHTDVYGLGAVLCELLMGQPPSRAAMTGDTLNQLCRNGSSTVRGRYSEVPRDLESICLQCLGKEPHNRYTSAVELAADLRRFQAAKPTVSGGRSSRKRHSHEFAARWQRP